MTDQTRSQPADTREQLLRRWRKMFNNIVLRYDKGETLGHGDVGFLIALIEQGKIMTKPKDPSLLERVGRAAVAILSSQNPPAEDVPHREWLKKRIDETMIQQGSIPNKLDTKRRPSNG